jgi:hypothetical protein
MHRQYWVRVRSRAWRDTLVAASLDTWQRVMIKALVALIAIALIGYFGGAEDVKSKIFAGLSTLVAFTVVFIIFYIWNLFSTPPKLDSEEKSKQKALDIKISQLEALGPNLRTEINTIVFGGTAKEIPDVRPVFFVLTVLNSGTLASIVRNWLAWIEHNGVAINGRVTHIAGPITFGFPSPSGPERKVTYSSNDMIYMRSAVAPGEMIQGGLLVNFDSKELMAQGISQIEAGLHVVLRFEDVLGKDSPHGSSNRRYI